MDFRLNSILCVIVLLLIDEGHAKWVRMENGRMENPENPWTLWPNGDIHFYLDKDYTTLQRAQIKTAMVRISQDTGGCVKFLETTADAAVYKLKITPNKGDAGAVEHRCYTVPGRLRANHTGEQIMVLTDGDDGCFHEGPRSLMKYLTLSVGKRNEHQKAIRNDFLDISLDNVLPSMRMAFRTFPPEAAYSACPYYDYCSITHNQPRDYTQKGSDAAAFVVKQPPYFIPKMSHLSECDCKDITTMYGGDSSVCAKLDCAAQKMPPQQKPVPVPGSSGQTNQNQPAQPSGAAGVGAGLEADDDLQNLLNQILGMEGGGGGAGAGGGRPGVISGGGSFAGGMGGNGGGGAPGMPGGTGGGTPGMGGGAGGGIGGTGGGGMSGMGGGGAGGGSMQPSVSQGGMSNDVCYTIQMVGMGGASGAGGMNGGMGGMSGMGGGAGGSPGMGGGAGGGMGGGMGGISGGGGSAVGAGGGSGMGGMGMGNNPGGMLGGNGMGGNVGGGMSGGGGMGGSMGGGMGGAGGSSGGMGGGSNSMTFTFTIGGGGQAMGNMGSGGGGGISGNPGMSGSNGGMFGSSWGANGAILVPLAWVDPWVIQFKAAHSTVGCLEVVDRWAAGDRSALVTIGRRVAAVMSVRLVIMQARRCYIVPRQSYIPQRTTDRPFVNGPPNAQCSVTMTPGMGGMGGGMGGNAGNSGGNAGGNVGGNMGGNSGGAGNSMGGGMGGSWSVNSGSSGGNAGGGMTSNWGSNTGGNGGGAGSNMGGGQASSWSVNMGGNAGSAGTNAGSGMTSNWGGNMGGNAGSSNGNMGGNAGSWSWTSSGDSGRPPGVPPGAMMSAKPGDPIPIGSGQRFKRTMNNDQAYYKWPGNTVPYCVDPSYSPLEQAQIHAAFKAVQDQMGSCVQFVNTSADSPLFKVKVAPSDGQIASPLGSKACSSLPGASAQHISSGKKEQIMVLSKDSKDGCFDGTRHSLMKFAAIVLGLRSIHNRPDRDNHINLIQGNIPPGNQAAYAKFTEANATSSTCPTYDYCSITHNKMDEFSSAPGTPAFTVPNPPYFIPRLGELSECDCKELSALYRCNIQCKPLNCAGLPLPAGMSRPGAAPQPQPGGQPGQPGGQVNPLPPTQGPVIDLFPPTQPTPPPRFYPGTTGGSHYPTGAVTTNPPIMPPTPPINIPGIWRKWR
ncbi:LOW QUALITY PROTEIN: uncharacterized protein LOC129598594 [Paramacrobiotus metropolitanus]|uniref:LOW QUALITY PROTEIN: uncharacterized protein LOC129598594 n=1 Tax=Paramacrobiotus metropolitanus TaxID=2943436 RepID=UPI002445CC94|nr:LOW QUALITY PROTEIN: uncharacterized protein LOC129598594 [Paramacrobiotus metropolitanus]